MHSSEPLSLLCYHTVKSHCCILLPCGTATNTVTAAAAAVSTVTLLILILEHYSTVVNV
jgi:hypothetical protein